MSFFYRQTRSKTILSQNLLVCIHSYSSPHSIWISLWFDWKTLFLKLHIETFIGDKIWQQHEYSFRRQPRSKIPCVSEPASCLHFYSSPHFLTRLKNIFCETAFRAFYRRKVRQQALRLLQAQSFTTKWIFFHRHPRSEILSASEPTNMNTLLL